MLADATSMAEFNAWANARLHGATAGLSVEEIGRGRGAFFGSILGTLNHILLVDLLYRERLEGRATAFKSLDETVEGDLSALTAAQRASDAYYIDYCAGIGEGDLERSIGFYTLMDEPDYWEVPLVLYLTNLFQHQVHHRGQAHNMLSQAGLEPPPIGYIEFRVDRGLAPVSG